MTATFGMGCFWGPEELFRVVPGVTDTAVGYMGGQINNPTYEQVCTNRTGHVEVVQLEYDPAQIPYEQLLTIFFENHDPTTVDAQGPDHGTQYRSVIFTHTPEQERAAHTMLETLDASGKYTSPIVTRTEPATTFWRAEDYHQKYLQKRGVKVCH